MPYVMRKVGKGWKVATKGTGHMHSKKPMTKRMASRQMRALYAAMKREGKL
jgi:hypothetical protein